MKNITWKGITLGFVYVLLVLAMTAILLEYSSNYKPSTNIHYDAPVITKKSIVVNAPIGTVWKVFSDIDHWDAWQKEIETPKINGIFKAGTSFNWKSNGLTITSTLQTVEANTMVGWSGPAFGAFAIHTWNFSEDHGQTTISVEESMEGWLVQLLPQKFQSGLDASIQHWLIALKSEAESAPFH